MTDVAANPKVTSTDYAHGISFGEAFVVWLRVAMLSFGGPAGHCPAYPSHCYTCMCRAINTSAPANIEAPIIQPAKELN